MAYKNSPKMLLTVQFPISDSRPFLTEPTGRLGIPTWQTAVYEGVDFVRSFGQINQRRLRGLNNWVGENYVCFAKRAVRFTDAKLSRAGGKNWKAGNTPRVGFWRNIQSKVAFRRFYSDGYATNKFELGISTRKFSELSFTADDLKTFITDCLDLRLKIAKHNEVFRLIETGKHLANFYAEKSTEKNFLKNEKLENWWVESRPPICFLTLHGKEDVLAALKPERIESVSAEKNFALYFSKFHLEAGNDIGLWVILMDKGCAYQEVRGLRIALLRLYAERECVRSILRNVGRNKIVIEEKIKNPVTDQDKRKNEASDIFQKYWASAYGKIGDFEKAAKHLIGEIETVQEEDEITRLSRTVEDRILPGDRQNIIKGLDNIRPNHRRNIEKFINTNIERQIMTEKHVEKEIHVGEHAVNAAYVEKVEGDFMQGSQKFEAVDIAQLAGELGKLREELDKRKSETDHYIDIGKVAEAEKAAKEGDESKVWSSLKTAGKWVLDTATDIGVKVAVDAIKQAAGLP